MPSRRTTPRGYEIAHNLRKQLTPAERTLWAHLRGGKIKRVNFRRQHAIGRYVVDFCAPRRKLVVELDGSHHLSQAGYDEERTKYLEARGFKVLRFWNDQVLSDFEGVVRAISRALESPGKQGG
jgi:very-short-patch-repair endonuclease